MERIERLRRNVSRVIPPSIAGRLRTIKRRLHPIDAACLSRALATLMDGRVRCLVVHSSLSSCGHIIGGPDVVIERLKASAETLVLPTHTYCYPSQEDPEVFDPAATPSRVGTISDEFWRNPGVVRSTHPTHSIAAYGPLAQLLCAGHETCDTPCGQGTPYVRLIAQEAAVLMFGASMNTYTLFHTAEDTARCPYLYLPAPITLRYRASNGSVVSMPMYRQDMAIARRFTAMRSVLGGQGLLRSAKLGTGDLLFIPNSARVHEFVVSELRKDPCYLMAGAAVRT